jgi:hypothetical protein
MFFGNNEADLDPSIGNRAYINPPARIQTESLGEKLRRKTTKTVVQNKPTKPDTTSADTSLVATPVTPQTILQKIPQSELEGTSYESQNATDMKTPPVTPDVHAKAP